MAVGCVAAVIASNFIPESDLAARAADYRNRAVRYTRPYMRRARKLASKHLPF
jgi:hypothetical protein